MNIKYSLCLILIIYSSLLFNKVKSITQYVYMEPFKSSDCTGESEGVGFVFQIGQCVGIGQYSFEGHNFMASYDGKGNVTISEYESTDSTCSNKMQGYDNDFQVSNCYNAPTYANNDYFSAANYVKVTVGPAQATPIYGYRMSTYDEDTCDSSPQFYYYYTNDTTIHFSPHHYVSFYCQYNTPMMDKCNGTATCYSYDVQTSCIRNFNFLHEHSYTQVTC